MCPKLPLVPPKATNYCPLLNNYLRNERLTVVGDDKPIFGYVKAILELVKSNFQFKIPNTHQYIVGIVTNLGTQKLFSPS